MISFLILLGFLIVGIGWAVSTREHMYLPPSPPDRYGDTKIEFNPKWLVMPILIAVVGLLVSIFQPYVFTRVDAGCVGIEANLTGDTRGVSSYEYKMGWVTYNDWTKQLWQYEVTQQHIEYDTITVILKGGFPAKITPSFNYALVTGAVGDMFINLRKPLNEIEHGWLKNAIFSSVNDVANKWTMDSLFNNRESFEAGIIVECNKRVSKWFTVSQLRSNIMPPRALEAAVAEKTRQIQLAQGENAKALTAEATGRVKIATAKADSAQTVITASGKANGVLIEARAEAKAIELKQHEVTNTYVDFIKAQNWDGKLPTTVLGNTTPMISIK